MIDLDNLDITSVDRDQFKAVALRLRVEKGLSNRKIAERLGVNEKTIRRWLSVKQQMMFQTDQKPWQLKGDYAVCGDLHADTCDFDMITTLIEWSKRFGVKKLIIAGDLFSFSGLQSKYPKVYSQASPHEEFEIVRNILEICFSYFEEIRVFIGNHDERFLATFNGGLTFEDASRMFCPPEHFKKLFVNDCNYCFLENGKKKWLVMHAYEYSPVPLVVARRFARKHQMNVIQHHQHITGEGLCEDNRFVVIDNGCMCHMHLTKYASKRVSSLPDFAKGFVILFGGQHVRYVEANN